MGPIFGPIFRGMDPSTCYYQRLRAALVTAPRRSSATVTLESVTQESDLEQEFQIWIYTLKRVQDPWAWSWSSDLKLLLYRDQEAWAWSWSADLDLPVLIFSLIRIQDPEAWSRSLVYSPLQIEPKKYRTDWKKRAANEFGTRAERDRESRGSVSTSTPVRHRNKTQIQKVKVEK